MTTMSDIPTELEEKILSRVPLTSLCAVRSTCKKWNSLSKIRIICGKANQFLGFMMKDYRVCSMKFDLGNGRDFVHPSIKQVSIFDRVEISQFFHCDGLLLCVTKDNSSLFVWNPYLGQAKLIQPRNNFHKCDKYAIGYDNHNRNHKILRIFGLGRTQVFGYEIYNLRTKSWKVFNPTPSWDIGSSQLGVSVKGNAYFLAEEEDENFIVSFDFTTERFGPLLPMPSQPYSSVDKFVSLSCGREKQLAVLLETWRSGNIALEIWVTNKIDPGSVSWSSSKFLRSFPGRWRVNIPGGSFFIDEEENVAVVLGVDDEYHLFGTLCNQTANILGPNGYFKSANIGKSKMVGTILAEYCCPLVSSSYVPSLVQLTTCTRKETNEYDYY